MTDPRHARPEFTVAVESVVAGIPAGEVLTYGEVAAEAGFPGAARAVGGVLAGSGGSLPWWRVVTAAGRLVPGHEVDHARRLRAEGVRLSRSGTRVAMAGH
jgi:methylated-DNA-protein-cysteine methyltransferase related protein